MSISVSTIIWQTKLPAMDKIVLLRMAEFSNDDGGSIYPAVSRLVDECGVSERHVQGVIKKYLASGLLVMVRQGGGRNRPTEYRIDLSNAKQRMSCGVLGEETAHDVRGITTLNPAPGAPIKAETPQMVHETPQITTLNPAPGAPDPSLPANKEGDDASATDGESKRMPMPADADRPDHCVIGRKIAKLCGLENDPSWVGNYSIVQGWLNQGADAGLILGTVNEVLIRAGPEADIRGLKYFHPAISRAILDRNQPIQGVDHGTSTGRYQQTRKSSGGGFAQALERRLAERGC